MPNRTIHYLGAFFGTTGFVYLALVIWTVTLASTQMALHNGPGVACCATADGWKPQLVEWDTTKKGYRVMIEGHWIDVPDETVIHGPNKLGHAEVWYYHVNGLPAVTFDGATDPNGDCLAFGDIAMQTIFIVNRVGAGTPGWRLCASWPPGHGSSTRSPWSCFWPGFSPYPGNSTRRLPWTALRRSGSSSILRSPTCARSHRFSFFSA